MPDDLDHLQRGWDAWEMRVVVLPHADETGSQVDGVDAAELEGHVVDVDALETWCERLALAKASAKSIQREARA